MCVLAVAILNNNDPEIIQHIMNGIDYGMYTVVLYCSPECMLATMAA